MEFPRITFGIIVLNGEPFIRYTLRALYPFAHEIIVVEGATHGAKNVATANGHSRDTTLETLHQFKAHEDSEDKLIIITQDGFWSEKDDMSQAYAKRATGDYLWQVDVDEFYHPQDMQTIIKTLRDQPSITAVSFKTITFWGAPDYAVDGWYLRRGADVYHRLFKWGDDYTYVTHRPPTVHNAQGQDMRDLDHIIADVPMYHYSLLLPKQVIEKCDYYSNAQWAKRQGALDWANHAYLELDRPYRVHNIEEYPSWLYRFIGEHPPEIIAMWNNLISDQFEIRRTDDIEQLLNSTRYQVGRWLVMQSNHPALLWKYTLRRIKAVLSKLTPKFIKQWVKSR
jgi:glycosyltransferase involved in cell wall biosynthesis